MAAGSNCDWAPAACELNASCEGLLPVVMDGKGFSNSAGLADWLRGRLLRMEQQNQLHKHAR